MKKIALMITLVLTILMVSIPTHAVEYNDIDDIIIPTITYIPHGVDGQGDMDVSPAIIQVTNQLTDQAYQGKTLYIVSSRRPITFQYNINNITYSYDNVSRYEIIFDWYSTTSSRRYIINLYNSSNALIHTETVGVALINFIPSTYIINTNTYDNGLADGSQMGYNQAKEEYGVYFNGQWLTAIEYGTIQRELGRGENENQSALGTMFGGLASLLGVGLAFILQLGSIELMGISLNMILGIGLLLVGLIAILGLVFGGK